MRSVVIRFPGSNCDRDMIVAIEKLSGTRPAVAWHADSALPDRLDLIAIPGGFSYGDYLRAGAMAARAPVMRAVAQAAERGVPVLGVCNGFQILTEAGLLPGALMRNAGLSFVCRTVELEVVSARSPFLSTLAPGARLNLPIAHHDGSYFADDDTLDRLEGEGQVALRYTGPVNGSCRRIAGITNGRGNVLGMMPHPERAVEPAHGNEDGAQLFRSGAAVLAS